MGDMILTYKVKLIFVPKSNYALKLYKKYRKYYYR